MAAQEVQFQAAPLFDEQCEKHLLATIIMYDGMTELARLVTPECFHNAKYREIYKACAELYADSIECTVINVTARLLKAGKNYAIDIAELSDVPYTSTLTAEGYAMRLKELQIKRSFVALGQKITRDGQNETTDVDEIERNITDALAKIREGVALDEEKTMDDSVTELIDQIIENGKHKELLTGTPTPFKVLNEKGGLQGSDLIIIAGESSQGKTSLALSFVRQAIKTEKIAFYSMEMTSVQLAARMLAGDCGISSSDLLYSNSITGEQLDVIGKASSQLEGQNLFVDEASTSTLGKIIESIKRLHRKHGIKGAVVDYLQILNVNTDTRGMSREQLMGDAARRLKNLAKELNIWIIALSQLNRDKQDPVPTMARLRDSGQIAEAADIVMMVYRPEVYGDRKFLQPFENESTAGKACIMVVKGRNIGIFNFLADFHKEITTFTDCESPTLVIGNREKTDKMPF